MCEHEWKWDKNWRENVEIFCGGEAIGIPVHCTECKKLAYEVYNYSCKSDRDTGKMIEA